MIVTYKKARLIAVGFPVGFLIQKITAEWNFKKEVDAMIVIQEKRNKIAVNQPGIL